MKNIIIKLRENEDRSIVFKMPDCGRLDFRLALHPLKEGTFNVSWEIKEWKDAIKEVKNVRNIGESKGKESNDKK